MTKYDGIISELFTDWYEQQISSFIGAKQNLQLISGNIPKQNIGRISLEALQSSKLYYEYIPISFDDDVDLKETTLTKLISQLPWGELNNSLNLTNLKKKGIQIHGDLSSTISQLLKFGIGGSASISKEKTVIENFVKKLNLKELISTSDVVKLFYEWSEKTNLPWKDGIYFYIHFDIDDVTKHTMNIKSMLNDIALDYKKRTCTAMIVENQIDFSQITNNTTIHDYKIRTDYDLITTEVLQSAKTKIQNMSTLTKFPFLNKKRKKLNQFLDDSKITSNLSNIISESQYDLELMEGLVQSND